MSTGPGCLRASPTSPTSAGWIVHWLWQRGIAADQVLGSASRGGGLETLAALLEDQIARRADGELPVLRTDPAWMLSIEGVDPLLERVRESLLTLADGRLGTRGSALVEQPGSDPAVLMSGVYARRGAETHLLPAPALERHHHSRRRDGPGQSRARSPRRRAAPAGGIGRRPARRAAAVLAGSARDGDRARRGSRPELRAARRSHRR